MSWIEIVLAFASNISSVASWVSVLSALVFFVLLMMTPMLIDDIGPLHDHRASFLKFMKRLGAFVLVLGLFASIPDVDDLWKIRIGLIKLQLASPENIQKGADVIERIGQKLECKYLGCEEKKK